MRRYFMQLKSSYVIFIDVYLSISRAVMSLIKNQKYKFFCVFFFFKKQIPYNSSIVSFRFESKGEFSRFIALTRTPYCCKAFKFEQNFQLEWKQSKKIVSKSILFMQIALIIDKKLIMFSTYCFLTIG